MSKRVIVFIFFMLQVALSLHAQQTREVFGKNRIQYQEFNWRYYSTTNFDIYFYGKSDKIALQASNFLEDEFERITEIVGYSPYFKTKVFLYNSITDKQQSNMGVNKISHRVGGQTNFIKSYVEVAYQGTTQSFKEELVKKVSNLVLTDMMFGGNLSDMWQNSYLMNLPEWFVKGASEYLALGWDINMDDRVRDMIMSGKIKKLNRLSGEEAVIAGQSMWNFLVEKYGRSNINQILNLVRVTRNEEKSIAFTLGIPFRQIIFEWQEYYADMALSISNNYVSPDENFLITRMKNGSKITAISLSPDGAKLAYAQNDNGKYAVYIKNFGKKNAKKIFKGGTKTIDQETENTLPLLNWADDNTLGIIEVNKGLSTLWLYDVQTQSKLPARLRDLNKVESFDFSGNGRLAVLSASRNGKNDIYLLSVRRNRLRRLTNDNFDDITPSFIPNTNTVIFSSNRISDSLAIDQKDYENVSNNYNLYVFNLDTTKTVLGKITNTISKDINPIAKDASITYYESDQKGIYNLFRYSIEDSIYKQVTNFSMNMRQIDANFNSNGLAYTMIHNNEENLYYQPNFNFEGSIFTPVSKRQQAIQVKYIVKKRLERATEERNKKKRSLASALSPTQSVVVQKNDTTSTNKEESGVIDTDNYVFGEQEVEEKIADSKDSDIIDTDDYVFDKDVVTNQKNTGSFLSNYRRFEIANNPIGPLPYETRFSADNMITSWVIDPLRGFGILLEAEMNDMLENHKFLGGIMSSTNLQSGDIFAEYQFLQYQIDYSARFEHNVWRNIIPSIKQRYSADKFEVGAALPINVKTRLAVNPFFIHTRFQDLEPNPSSVGSPIAGSSSTGYLGIKANYVFDNSTVAGQNMMEGTRFKISYTHHEAINNRARSFDNISIDLRHYQKIHRSLTLAARLFYGKFMGNYKHSYLLGGMDNWLFKNDHSQDSPWQPEVSKENNNIYFLEHVTSLRGFDYNTLSGTDAVLLNMELRLPLAKYFYNGPISSAFIKNLQFVGFFDIGSSWTGPSPFSENNTISTVIEEDKIFQAVIQTFRNPWLYGYGAGMRSVILGYFMKFDLAWPVENYEVGNPKFYITLGHDF